MYWAYSWSWFDISNIAVGFFIDFCWVHIDILCAYSVFTLVTEVSPERFANFHSYVTFTGRKNVQFNNRWTFQYLFILYRFFFCCSFPLMFNDEKTSMLQILAINDDKCQVIIILNYIRYFRIIENHE